MPLLPFLPLGRSPSSSLGVGWPSLALLLPLLALLASPPFPFHSAHSPASRPSVHVPIPIPPRQSPVPVLYSVHR
ncbi:hypothetical protein FB451DRAFT_1237693, partial [Mycena latifolia]